eukprot:71378-Hanusia_phi.AAC.1
MIARKWPAARGRAGRQSLRRRSGSLPAGKRKGQSFISTFGENEGENRGGSQTHTYMHNRETERQRERQ